VSRVLTAIALFGIASCEVDPSKKATQRRGYLRSIISRLEPRHAPPDRFLYLRTIRTSLQAADKARIPRSYDHKIAPASSAQASAARSGIVSLCMTNKVQNTSKFSRSGTAIHTVKVTSAGPVPHKRESLTSKCSRKLLKSPWKIRKVCSGSRGFAWW
jgi:hypothetical protein